MTILEKAQRDYTDRTGMFKNYTRKSSKWERLKKFIKKVFRKNELKKLIRMHKKLIKKYPKDLSMKITLDQYINIYTDID